MIYDITITNNDTEPAWNIRIWDSLPAQLQYYSTEDQSLNPVIAGNFLEWDLPPGVVLMPGGSIVFEFTTVISSMDYSGYFLNAVSVDYNDPFYSPVARHPAVTSSAVQYPGGPIVAFPNPFQVSSADEVKFSNVPPGSELTIATISGEIVYAIDVIGQVRAKWDGRNNRGQRVSAGIYYYIVRNMQSGQITRGKLFVVK